jgi:membrane protease subunit (stomatin/prohibitin family)
MIVGAAVVSHVAASNAAAQQAAADQAAAPAPAPAAPDINTQIQQLAQLHTTGVLTDEEFAAAKAKLLAS